MTYSKWFEDNTKKHKKILGKLKDKSIDEIIEYFLYENMKKNEEDFCPLYKDVKKCHNMEKLNCYFCACPYFRFKDKVGFEKKNGKTLYSFCSINAKDGKIFETEDAIHQDCSSCLVPHSSKFVKRFLYV